MVSKQGFVLLTVCQSTSCFVLLLLCLIVKENTTKIKRSSLFSFNLNWPGEVVDEEVGAAVDGEEEVGEQEEEGAPGHFLHTEEEIKSSF